MSLWVSDDAKGTLIEAPITLPKPHAGYPDLLVLSNRTGEVYVRY
jgi:hypothetical protein